MRRTCLKTQHNTESKTTETRNCVLFVIVVVIAVAVAAFKEVVLIFGSVLRLFFGLLIS